MLDSKNVIISNINLKKISINDKLIYIVESLKTLVHDKKIISFSFISNKNSINKNIFIKINHLRLSDIVLGYITIKEIELLKNKIIPKSIKDELSIINNELISINKLYLDENLLINNDTYYSLKSLHKIDAFKYEDVLILPEFLNDNSFINE